MTRHLDEETLNLHFDGELEPTRSAGAQQHLDGCAECSKRLHALERLRSLVVLSAETAAQGVDFDRMFAEVEREARTRPPLPFLERMKTLVQELIEHKPMQVFVPAAGVLAAAAWLLFATGTANGPTTPPVTADRGAPEAAREERDPGVERERIMLADKLESEVVQVDFGENSGTVFEIALADGASTPVVWINDEE